MVSPPCWRVIWLSAGALATTRVVLLAHYLTDVLSGLAIGIFVDHIVMRLRRSALPEVLAHSPDKSRKTQPHGKGGGQA
jgi:membrane-associated phospholipid phosphatase